MTLSLNEHKRYWVLKLKATDPNKKSDVALCFKTQLIKLCLVFAALPAFLLMAPVEAAQAGAWYLITAPEKQTSIMGHPVAERIFGSYIDKCKLVDDEYVIKKNALLRNEMCGELNSISDNTTGKVVEQCLLCRDGRLTEVSFFRDKNRCSSQLQKYFNEDAANEAKAAKNRADAKTSDDRFRTVSAAAEKGWWRLQLKNLTCHHETFTARDLQTALNAALCSGSGTEALTMIECPYSKTIYVMAKTESECNQAAAKLRPQAKTIANSEGKIPRDKIAENQKNSEDKQDKSRLAIQKAKQPTPKKASATMTKNQNAAEKARVQRLAEEEAKDKMAITNEDHDRNLTEDGQEMQENATKREPASIEQPQGDYNKCTDNCSKKYGEERASRDSCFASCEGLPIH